MPEYKNTAGKKKPQKSNYFLNTVRVLFFWVIVAVFVVAVFGGFNRTNTVVEEEKSITEVLTLVNEGSIDKIIVKGDVLHVVPKENSDMNPIVSRKESGSSLQEQGFDEAVKEGLVNIEVQEDIDMLSIILDAAIIVKTPDGQPDSGLNNVFPSVNANNTSRTCRIRGVAQ